MTVLRGFSITIASGLAFGIFGGLAGYLLGSIAPDYYRVVFGISRTHAINMAQFGLALGLTQGVIGGLLIGVGVVVAVAWYNSRIGSGNVGSPDSKTATAATPQG